ncbi:MAG: hypothetical protein LBT66_09320 [Methanobrevibacter sp.]|jgi:hypothetical protein|nr:hypothetical protein [Candidatus Methanovirga meridionalis]
MNVRNILLIIGILALVSGFAISSVSAQDSEPIYNLHVGDSKTFNLPLHYTYGGITYKTRFVEDKNWNKYGTFTSTINGDTDKIVITATHTANGKSVRIFAAQYYIWPVWYNAGHSNAIIT